MDRLRKIPQERPVVGPYRQSELSGISHQRYPVFNLMESLLSPGGQFPNTPHPLNLLEHAHAFEGLLKPSDLTLELASLNP
ncbi:hypothetical protein D3C86_1909720 [compost metagenome]